MILISGHDRHWDSLESRHRRRDTRPSGSRPSPRSDPPTGRRAAERSLLAGIRPLLIPSRPQDPTEKVGFADNHWLVVQGGHTVAEAGDEAIYLAIALKNTAAGMAVLDRWYVHSSHDTSRATGHKSPNEFAG